MNSFSAEEKFRIFSIFFNIYFIFVCITSEQVSAEARREFQNPWSS